MVQWMVSLSMSLLFMPISNECDRYEVIRDYNEVFLQTSFTTEDLAWDGDLSACEAGNYSSVVEQKILARINYFRRQCDLNDDVVFSQELNDQCQEAAMVSAVNGALSHCQGVDNAPCNTWSCVTDDAISALQRSNLAWANWDAYDPIELYMSDFGAGNIAVGHRRWLLFSRAKVFGCGTTDDRNVIWVFGNQGNPLGNKRDYIAYPPADYVVQDLVYSRWSFGIPNADFTQAQVQMIDDYGQDVPLNIVYNQSVGFGDYSIVWEPENIVTDDIYDREYHVNIRNIGNAPSSSYTYTVTVVPNFYPPNCRSGLYWSETNCECQTEPDCPESLAVHDSPLCGTFEASGVIESTGVVKENGEASFECGDEISLDQGFEVELGSEFVADINEDPCGNQSLNEDNNSQRVEQAGFRVIAPAIYHY